MRAPFTKAPAPRIRSLSPSPVKAKPAPQPSGVFRDFVATLDRLEKAKRRKKPGKDA